MIVMKRKLCWAINLSFANEKSEVPLEAMPTVYTAMLIRSLQKRLISSDRAISWYSTERQITACAWIDGGACTCTTPSMNPWPPAMLLLSPSASRQEGPCFSRIFGSSLHRLWLAFVKVSEHNLYAFLASCFKNPEKPLSSEWLHFCFHCLQQIHNDDIEKSGVLYSSFMLFFRVFMTCFPLVTAYQLDHLSSINDASTSWSRVRYGKARRRWTITRRIESGNSETKKRRTRNGKNIRRRNESRGLVQTVYKLLIEIL